MDGTTDNTDPQALIDEAATWAVDCEEANEVFAKAKPIIEHIHERSQSFDRENLVDMGKLFMAGYYFGKYEFPQDRTSDLGVFEQAFDREE